MIMLAVLTLVTVLVVSLLLTTQFERTAASLQLGRTQAAAFADYGADIAISRLGEAIGNGMSPGRMWISEPGRIRTYDRANLASYQDFEMFSALPEADDPTLKEARNVDLNRKSLNGVYPIAAPAAGQALATMKVGWKNLLKNPDQPPSATNPIVGRIAYWVDDESCKVNVNTADGSKKQDLYRIIGPNEVSQSFGFGTPSEISLEALVDSNGTALTNATAAAVAGQAWSREFNALDELVAVSGFSADFLNHNRFNLTCHSRIPEVTFFGEPRIYLFPIFRDTSGTFNFSKIRTLTTGGSQNYLTQVLGGSSLTFSGPIDFIYPIANPSSAGSNQFTFPLYQYANANNSMGSNSGALSVSTNRDYVNRIANAIAGRDGKGNSITWPAFGGVTTGFSQKYLPRQIDSIALQIYDLSNTTVFSELNRVHTLPTIAPDGLVNSDASQSRMVIGLSRGVKLTEVYMQAIVTSGSINGQDVARLQLRTDMEYLYPEFYSGAPLHPPYTGGSYGQFRLNNTSGGPANYAGPAQLTLQDSETAASTFGGYWADDLLQILDQADDPAGFDLMGNPSDFNDPDQNKASLYHPYRLVGGTYKGGVSNAGRLWPMFEISNPQDDLVANPGTYFSKANRYKIQIFHPGKPGISQLRFRGGLSLWNRTGTGSGGWNMWEPVPLEGIRGPLTGESVTSSANKARLQEAVIPINFNVILSGPNGSGAEYFNARVADPLVNKFPGDWIREVDPANLSMVLNSVGNTDTWRYRRTGSVGLDPGFEVPVGTTTPAVQGAYLRTFNGDNPEFRPVGGGDPLSLWLPRVDIRYPKGSRFPSVGALNYIRTGMIPDDLGAPLSQQRGTPWRSINFSAATSLSQTVHGVNYPDWVMLDLFTVPFLPQRPYASSDFQSAPSGYGMPRPAGLTSTASLPRKLTAEGASAGKINLNNPRIPHPFNQYATQWTPPERTAPLEALFYGIKTAGGPAGNAFTSAGDPIYQSVDHAALRGAVQQYLENDANRFLLPGQLADLPAVNAHTYSGVAANVQSRNDLVRQVVGATTTQSNVFSIWVVSQSIHKISRNTGTAADCGSYQPGDIITGEVRRHYVVERLIEVGRDGVPGNARAVGADGILGTADDVLDSDYHPIMPQTLPYRWRILSMEVISA